MKFNLILISDNLINNIGTLYILVHCLYVLGWCLKKNNKKKKIHLKDFRNITSIYIKLFTGTCNYRININSIY